MSALATIERTNGRAMIVADAIAQEGEQRKLLGAYVAQQMTEGTDFGVIPGTKNKTLLKPGAEKLTTLFRCVPRFVIEEKIENWETGLFFYRFSCHIETVEGGSVVAEGVGSCSTYESRYRWRNGDRKCPHCGAAAILKSKKGDGWFCWGKKGGCGANFEANDESITGQQTGRVQNPDLADCANTVLKMAKKRAHVDAAIALARCSDMFTQDAEDFSGVSDPEPQQTKPEPITEKAFGELLARKGWNWPAFVRRINQMRNTSFPEDATFKEMDQHTDGFAAWLAGRPDKEAA